MVSADGPGAPSLGGQFFDDFYREQGEDPGGSPTGGTSSASAP